jgi:glyoxylase-like metal-dependent hydrolase (beta-lactamase superfamily II)
MQQEMITVDTKKVNEYLYHIDAHAYGTSRMLSIFVAEFEDYSVVIDCGSSLDIKKLLRSFKKLGIKLSSIKYLITTHHHFDHNGGAWQFYDILKEYNPNIKILTNKSTKELLNNFEQHLARGKRTYGDLTGVMKPIPENAFRIIEPTKKFSDNLFKNEIVDTFTLNNHKIHLGILYTPGHTPDHQSPIFIKNNTLDFIHFGESVGTIYHKSKLITMPTSMPIYYNHQQYMETLNNLKKINPLRAGYGHFGLIYGEKNVRTLLLEHEEFMNIFRKKIIEFYSEKPATSYVFEKMLPFLLPRTDLDIEDNPVFEGIALAIVYGMLMDLGYRKE